MEKKEHYDELEEKIALLEEKVLRLGRLKNAGEVNEMTINKILDSIPIPFFYKDANGIYQHCNEVFAETILGLKKENIIGNSLYDLAESIPKSRADKYHYKDEQIFQQGKRQYYDAKVQCADGIARYYYFHKIPFIVESEILGIFGLMLDVSQYKRALLELDKMNAIWI